MQSLTFGLGACTEWQPDEQAWAAYIKLEKRYGELDRVRTIFERCTPLPSFSHPTHTHTHTHKQTNKHTHTNTQDTHGAHPLRRTPSCSLDAATAAAPQSLRCTPRSRRGSSTASLRKSLATLVRTWILALSLSHDVCPRLTWAGCCVQRVRVLCTSVPSSILATR
jgi:hypothetical protein